jgi:hypothetical protein
MVMVYVLIAMLAMLGICSLAVDIGRVQVAKTGLRIAADAAARQAIYDLSAGSSTSTAIADAVAMAANNKCDGVAVSLNSGTDVVVGRWNTSTKTFSANSNPMGAVSPSMPAVQVYARRTSATNNPIPTIFAQALGIQNSSITATSVAALVSVTAPITQFVSAHGDPWLAGEPANTLASEPDTGYGTPSNNNHPWEYDIANPGLVDTSSTVNSDSSKVERSDYSSGEPYASPVAYKVSPGAMIQISVPLNSSNEASNSGYLTSGSGSYTADGMNSGSQAIYSDDAANPGLGQGSVTTSGSEHGISNIAAPLNSLLGVFLNQAGATSGADSQTAPAGVDYSTQTAQNYTTMEPLLNQSFFIGNGSTSGGSQQTIVVPANSYKLYLGTMDGHEWSNNVGGYNATITQNQIEVVQ